MQGDTTMRCEHFLIQDNRFVVMMPEDRDAYPDEGLVYFDMAAVTAVTLQRAPFGDEGEADEGDRVYCHMDHERAYCLRLDDATIALSDIVAVWRKARAGGAA